MGLFVLTAVIIGLAMLVMSVGVLSVAVASAGPVGAPKRWAPMGTRSPAQRVQTAAGANSVPDSPHSSRLTSASAST